MFDINNTDDIKLYEDKLSDATKTKTIQAIKCSFDKPSGRFLKLISIFEMGKLDKKLKFLSQRQLTITADTMVAAHPKASSATDDSPAAAGVAVSSRVADARPKQSLLVVVHPWHAFRQSAAAADRQSEFPPPGFLKHLRAKFLAILRETTANRLPQPKNREPNAACLIRYAAAALGRPCGSNDNKAVMASDAAGDNKLDFKNTTVTVCRGHDDRMQ